MGNLREPSPNRYDILVLYLVHDIALVRNYLKVYWPRAGGLSAVNAIGTQLRDPINSGLTRWRMAVINE